MFIITLSTLGCRYLLTQDGFQREDVAGRQGIITFESQEAAEQRIDGMDIWKRGEARIEEV